MLKKIFRRDVFTLVSLFSFIWFLVLEIGTPYAKKYSSTINSILNEQETITIGGGNTYYQSKFLDETNKKDDKAMRENSMNITRAVDNEGTVLLWNKNNALPLSEGNKVSLFGIASAKYQIAGGGSGAINATQPKNFMDTLETSTSEGGAGFVVNHDLFNAYDSLKGSYGSTSVQGSLTKDPKYNGKNGYTDGRYREFYINEVPWDILNSKVSGGIDASIAKYEDAAIMTITRDGSEDGDTWFKSDECFDNNYLDLSFKEAEVLEKLVAYKNQGKIKKVIVILNNASPLQMKHLLNYDIDACLLAGEGGLSSFMSLGDILSGRANPSGALVNAIAYDHYSAPATVNFGDFKWAESRNLPETNLGVYNNFYNVYQEGIYVGYRYYETRYEDTILGVNNASSSAGVKNGETTWKYESEVAFPFGYGLSYTNFEFSNLKVEHESGDFLGTYKVSVNVKNVGKTKGKTPIQVYLQKPYTEYDVENGVEKASIELVGFEKTDLLEPGEDKTYEVSIKGSELKTFDTYGKGTYILEKGNYYLSVGSDSHAALNNILASKGKKAADGMVDSRGQSADGNAKLSHLITINEDDYEIFAKSEYTNYKVESQLQDGDVNLYEGTKDQKQQYLSRSNWKDTYPTPVILKCINDRMVSDMQYGHGPIDATGYEMPLYSTKTIDDSFFDKYTDLKEKKLKLIMLLDLEYDDPVWDDLLNQFSFQEMNYLLSGGYLNVNGSSKGLPAGRADDGSSGVRTNNPTFGTLMGFSNETLMAQTWNKKLVKELGEAFGHECFHAGVHQLYAPTCNTHRTPYGGRNWECFSEDPYISGMILANEVQGIQSVGVVTTVKHFAFNDQEINRCGDATFLNEQTAREIYLKSFEIGVTEGKTGALMASFVRLGCIYGGSNYGLMHEILRQEWGFKGFVETDSAFNQEYMTTSEARAEAVIAGVDFWMDGAPNMQWANYANNAKVCQAVRESTHRYLYTFLHSSLMNGVSSNTQIIKVVPKWKTALNVACLVVGIITALLFACTAFAFFIHRNDENKNKDKETKLQKMKDNPKKNNIISISGLTVCCIAFISISTITATTSVKNFKKLNDDNIVDGGSTKPNEKKNHFGIKEKEVFYNGVYNEDQDCVGTVGVGLELTISYYIEAPEASNYKLIAEISKNPEMKTFTDVYRTFINGEQYMSDTQTDIGTTWFEYGDIEVGQISLNKGINEITFKYIENDPAKSFNFRSITLEGKDELKLVEKPTVVIEGSYTFKAIDSKVEIINSGSKQNKTEDCIGWDANLGDHVEFAYYIKSDKAESVDFYVEMSSKPSPEIFTDVYQTTINGTNYHSDTQTPIGGMWSDYTEIYLGKVDLKAGTNIIKFTYRPADWQTFNFRSIRFQTDSAKLTWAN